MQIRHLFRLIRETGLSPEQFGVLIDISGLTLRRWRQRSPVAEVPKFYQRLVIDLVPQLVHEGLLSPKSRALRSVLRTAHLDGMETMAKGMGFEPVFIDGAQVAQEMHRKRNAQVIENFARIGANEAHKVSNR